jgi:hypothetical protein
MHGIRQLKAPLAGPWVPPNHGKGAYLWLLTLFFFVWQYLHVAPSGAELAWLGLTLLIFPPLKAELAGKLLGRDEAACRQQLRDIEHSARDALSEVRSAVSGDRQTGFAHKLAGPVQAWPPPRRHSRPGSRRWHCRRRPRT